MYRTMTEVGEVFKCEVCGNIVQVTHDGPGKLVCCDKPMVLQMLSVGDESAAVDEMLLQVAQHYEREVNYDLKRLTDLMEPMLLLVMGSMVLLLAFGVFLPMWNMVDLIH